jgi:5-methyltetrahydropteroyltriglutamate--homocysteine methyltransferase
MAYVVERFTGVEPRPRQGPFAPGPGKDRRDFAEFYEGYDRMQRTMWQPPDVVEAINRGDTLGTSYGWVCVGPISYKGQAAIQRDIRNFTAALAHYNVAEGFLPVATPGSAQAGRPNEHYGSDEEFLYAIADALKEEYRAIADAGLLLQVDDAFLPLYYDAMAIRPDFAMESYLTYAERRVEALNYALQGIPEDRVRFHVCWGSWNAPHSSDPPLKDIVGLVLKVNAGAFAIEAANPRHEHEWTVWEQVKLPEGKVLIPGCITHSTNIVEHPELVAQRIVRFARLVGRENVIAGADCGFAQAWDLVRTHPTVQWAKLRALAEGAALATKELWR